MPASFIKNPHSFSENLPVGALHEAETQGKLRLDRRVLNPIPSGAVVRIGRVEHLRTPQS